MPVTHLSIGNGSNPEAIAKIDGERTVNMYVLPSTNGKWPTCLAPLPGTQFALETSDAGFAVRGMYQYAEYIYAVIGSKIYRIDSLLLPSLIGTIGTTTGFVDIAVNAAKQMIFVDGQAGYLYDIPIADFHQITDPIFPSNPEVVEFIDGYFAVNNANTAQVYVSELNNGDVWPNNFTGFFDTQTDVVIGLQVLGTKLYVFGKRFTEIWYDSGEAERPLRKDPNLSLSYGCAAPHSIASGEQKIFWLSADELGVGHVLMTDGGKPKIISTQALETQLQNYIIDIQAIMYRKNGHLFYEMNFTDADHTWIYDSTTGYWLEGETEGGHRRPSSALVFFNDGHYIGHYAEPKILLLSSNVFTDEGKMIKRERITNHFTNPEYGLIHISKLEIDALFGEGIPNTEYEDTKIYMSFSRDGGLTFNNPALASFGKSGERNIRCFYNRLGTMNMRDLVFKFEIYSKNKVYLLDAAITYDFINQ